MLRSRLLQARADGSALYAIPSLSALRSLDLRRLEALETVGIRTLSDLLNWDPVRRARTIIAASRGEIAHDVPLRDLIDPAQLALPLAELPSASVAVLRGISAATTTMLRDVFGIYNLAQLAAFPPFVEASTFLHPEQPFTEPASAPPELLPRATGGLASIATYASFVRESQIRSTALRIVLDSPAVNGLDTSLWGLFVTEDRLELRLGYVAALKQRWITTGTALGEPLHSLSLAPGETRNVAVVDWKRAVLARRDENTEIAEQINSTLVHKRALDEVVRATATEHLVGGTKAAGATLGGASGGTISEAAVGAIAGAASGGLLSLAQLGTQGGGSGAQSGGFGSVLSGNLQYGKVETTSDGTRSITASTAQRINDVASQKSSALRSVWSTIVLSDSQTERAEATTWNVTNYNHSHALTVQYFEVLQRYRVEVVLDTVEPVLYLPFRPLTFNLETVTRWWATLRRAIPDAQLVAQFDATLTEAAQAEMPPETERSELVVSQVRFELVETAENDVSSDMVERVSWDRTTGDDLGFSRSGAVWRLNINSARPTVENPMRLNIRVRGNWLGKRTLIARAIATVINGTSSWSVPHDIRVEIPGVGNVGALNVSEVIDWLDEIGAYASAPEEAAVNRVLSYIATRRYAFTRLILQELEPEQFVDLVEALRFIPTDVFWYEAPHFPLIEFIEPAPIGVADNHFIFPLKRGVVIPFGTFKLPEMAMIMKPAGGTPASDTPMPRDFREAENPAGDMHASDTPMPRDIREAENPAGDMHASDTSMPRDIFEVEDPLLPSTFAALRPLRVYADGLDRWAITTRADGPLASDHVDLPTSGVFAEAILGRSNASEKIDLTRFWNWKDSPIPHLAPAINPVDTGTRATTTDGLTPTQAATVLNLMTPTALPDPNLNGVITAIQNGALFRDPTGQATLGQVLTNLSSLAEKTATVAGQLSGDAAAKALESATTLGQKVLSAATATPVANGSGGTGIGALAGAIPTLIGGAVNELGKLWSGGGGAADALGKLSDLRDMIGLPSFSEIGADATSGLGQLAETATNELSEWGNWAYESLVGSSPQVTNATAPTGVGLLLDVPWLSQPLCCVTTRREGHKKAGRTLPGWV
jgi:hypothetical protein